MKRQYKLIAALLLACLAPGSLQAATLDLDGSGNLLGANGVSVNGTLYDVSFGNGICRDFWDSCGNIIPAFTFQTPAAALAAATALITDLFSADDVFDAIPTLTNGCDDPSACFIITPYALDGDMETVFAYNALNLAGNGSDSVIPASIGTFTPTNPDATYARWSPSLAPVPVPAAVWLFLAAIAGIGAISRKKQSVVG